MVTVKVNSSLLFFFLLFVCVRRRGHKLHGLLLRIGRMDGVNTEIKKNSYFCDIDGQIACLSELEES